MLDLKSGDPEFKSHSDQQLDMFQIRILGLNSSAVLLHSQLVHLLSVGILNLFGSFVIASKILI